MGSKISIGLVYDEVGLESKVVILNSIINSLDSPNGVQSYKYSKDAFGNEWIYSDENVNMSNEVLQSILSYYFAELTLKINKILDGSHEVVIRVENEDKYFGILIDLDESNVQTTGYDVVEKRVVEYLSRMFKKNKYDYAFCENEGEIELSPAEINSNEEELFSILLRPEGELAKVYKSSWKLDGFSRRKF